MFSFKLKQKNKETKVAAISNPKILEVNLIREERGISFNWSKNLATMFLVFSVAAVVLAEIYFGLDWWQKQEIKKTELTVEEIARFDREISALNNQANEALKYQEKALALSSLLNNHVYWSNFLTWLEKNTLSSVQYEALSGDLSGAYTFAATAKTYADVSWQTKAFLNDPLTKKVSVDQASFAKSKDASKGSQVTFSLVLEVNPAVFKK